MKILQVFFPVSATQIATKQHRVAQSMALEHEAAAEHHAALAAMYRTRIQRLSNVIPIHPAQPVSFRKGMNVNTDPPTCGLPGQKL